MNKSHFIESESMVTCPFCEILSKVEKAFIIYAHDIVAF